ncbi:MAG: ATP-binding protein, partial [Massilia sp.]
AALARVTAAEEERRRLDMLAALDRAKTVFFSNVSHEFRTPLTLMLGPLEESLEAADLPGAQRERLLIAHCNAQRLLKLVNSLLDFSRIEAGRNDARFVPTDLAALTRDLVSNFSSACAQAGLALTVDCAPLPSPVHVDREMWEKIVLNLLSNAFKFTLEGGIAVTLREQRGAVALTVSDTGVGVPAADVPRLFERFHRVQGQRGRSVEGTGIGLSLVRELVQLHGGAITARSAPGQGTVFTLTLPFGAAHLPVDRVGQGDDVAAGAPAASPADGGVAGAFVGEALRWLPPATVANQAAAAGAGAVILLAEDNADMRAYIERILGDGGYLVRSVGNGAAALAEINAGLRPDLVLTDVMIPEMDGFALLQALRADSATRELVVMLLSARAGEEARVEGMLAGADDYLVKPFGARELRARIDGTIALARQRRRAAAREQALLDEIAAQRDRARLRESQASVATLFEQTAAGIAEIDLAGVIVRVNQRYCDIAGRSREELVGASVYGVMHPADAERAADLLREAVRSGEPFEIDNRYLRADGGEAWVSQAVTPIRRGHAPIRGALVVALDISQRKRAEQVQAETAERLAFILDVGQIGNWDLDLVADVCHRSLRHDRCFGYTEPVAHWGFETFMAHVHPDERAAVRARFEQALADLKDWHVETRVLWPDGSTHWIAAHGSLYHVDGRPVRMGGIVSDITERRQAEEALLQASQRKDEFLAMLAHELRNPLAPISAAAELMGVARLDEARLRKTSAIITRQVRHMTGLIDDLLDVSRVTRGLVAIARDPLDLRAVVAAAVEQVRPLIEARGHHLRVDPAPPDALVCGDQKRLVQVLTNLLNNAAKYTPEGGRIALRTELDADCVRLRVDDNGIGIAPELRAHVFDLFAQAERSSDRSQGGLGLGLALVKSLVDLHQGSVTCHSDGLGRGSSFAVTLPRLREKAAPALREPGALLPAAGRKLRIMVVDDNVDAAQMLAMVLQVLGHEVTVEHGSLAALAQAPIERPDVCLLDIGLPEMNGNELARKLRRNPASADALLIAVTGYGHEFDRQSALDAGFDHYFVKPVDTGRLNELLSTVSA